ncbi:hypothetical protein LIER_18691 [Lithospermum erythrorhizon]|uniref:Reverse transcriptase domain-containing protein n=1 Tax=Lithospermum erythrorhizon TaxID=34254 RepID=A0AAV3QEX6_LITER
MAGSKSPRPDGMPAKFFQHYWDIMGDTLTKVIAKLLALRLKKLLPNVILDSQSPFVPNRLITNNTLLAYEAHHLIKHRKQGNQGLMSIKLDMLKAYDRIEWAFLKGNALPTELLIMMYVELVTYSLLINGEQVGYIQPSGELIQGDPLSSYLFIICTEGLIALLKGAISRGELNGIKGLQPLSHLMFADDTLLLGQATIPEAQVIRDTLSRYELWSGQLENVQKSMILFSPNVPMHTRNEIFRVFGMPQVSTHGKYQDFQPTLVLPRRKFSTPS